MVSVCLPSDALLQHLSSYLGFSYLGDPMNSMKRQNDRILKEELPRSVVPNMLLEISGEITPERMKGWSQSKNNTQL